MIMATVTIAETSDTVIVIVHKENNNIIDNKLIVGIYTGVITSWPDGTPVFALDQARNTKIKNDYYLNIIGKSKITMRAIWAQNIFSGRSLPPETAEPDEEMKRTVSANKHAIGYIWSSSIDESVKLIKP